MFVFGAVILFAVLGLILYFMIKSLKSGGRSCPKGKNMDQWRDVTSYTGDINDAISICEGEFFWNNKPTCVGGGPVDDECVDMLMCAPQINTNGDPVVTPILIGSPEDQLQAVAAAVSNGGRVDGCPQDVAS